MLTRIFTATAVASLALGLAAACSPPTTPTEAASADTADMVKMALPHAKMANFTLKDTAGKAHELYVLFCRVLHHFVCGVIHKLSLKSENAHSYWDTLSLDMNERLCPLISEC